MFIKELSETFKSDKLKLVPFVAVEEAVLKGDYVETEGRRGYTLSCKTSDYDDTLYITECVGGYTVKRVFKNTSGAVMRLRELGVRLSGISFGAETKKDYYYHLETPRLFGVFTLTVDCNRLGADANESEFDPVAGNKWADPGVIKERIGTTPYQPFPAILVSNYDVKWGLVHGTLSQKIFYHNYLLSHSDGAVVMEIFSSFKDIPYREVRVNEVLTDEWFIGKTENADDIEKVFSEYTVELRKKLPANYGATKINRDNMVWGTWNDGIRQNVSEELILREAKELVEHFPNVRWIQIDDGYSVIRGIAHGLGVPYEGDEGVDKEKFPNGMRGISDKIREFGLRPAIWIGGACPKITKIVKERPEIMTDYLDEFRSYPSCPIDVSLPEAREYMTYALDTIISDWGFDGVKHDFWSYAFEVSEPILRNKFASGYEHRAWWLSEIRRRLPTDGYLQTGCDIVMGNPFLGEYFTNYRYGIDVGPGAWGNIKTNFLWGVACFATHTGDIFVPNSDSVGLLPGLSDTDAEFCINYILITRTMVELAGVFSRADKTSKRFAMLKKATCNVNNGQDVYLAGYDYRKMRDDPPEKLYLRTPHFSKESGEGIPLRTLGIFNIEDTESKTVTVRASELDLDPCEKYVVTDVWSGESFTLDGELDFELVPHQSRLLGISKSCGKQIYDANFEMKEVNAGEDKISAAVCYKLDTAELTLSHAPKAILLDGANVEFTVKDGKTCFAISGKGLLEIVF